MSLVHCKNVSLSFPNARVVLNKLDYTIEPGDFVILLGSNGSGKTSLLKLLNREYVTSQGEITFLNKPISAHSFTDFSSSVAILTQDCTASLFSSLTLYENYVLVKRHQRLQVETHKKEQQFLISYLEQFNPNLVQKLDLSIDVLSGGEKQAFALALRFLHPPQLLLLDEHTSALDPKTSASIMQLTHEMVKQHHITCVLTTHDLAIALEFGNRILLLREGQIHAQFDYENKKKLTRSQLLNCYH